MVTGILAAELDYACSSAWRVFRQIQDIPVNVRVPSCKRDRSEKHELHDDEMDMGSTTGEELDTQELLREQ